MHAIDDLTADEDAATCARWPGTSFRPSATYGVPGADDELIFSDILKSLERDLDDVRRALADLRRLAGGAFADLAPKRRKRGRERLAREGRRRRWPRSCAWCCSATTATTG